MAPASFLAVRNHGHFWNHGHTRDQIQLRPAKSAFLSARAFGVYQTFPANSLMVSEFPQGPLDNWLLSWRELTFDFRVRSAALSF